jgi:cysteine desulfurase
MIYFDNNSTTITAPEVLDAMKSFALDFCDSMELEENFQSVINETRQSLAMLVGAESAEEIFFTSSGTESIQQAISAALKIAPKKKHLITTTVEHESVRNFFERLENEGFQVTWINVDQDGFLDLEQLKNSLRTDTCLVSIMTANDKTGVIFPIDEAVRIVKGFSDAFFHSDGAIAVGKIPINLRQSGIDFFSFSGHKFHAPKHIGALYVNKKIIRKLPISIERQPPIRKIVGIKKAACMIDNFERIEALRKKLERSLLEIFPDAKIIGARNKRLPNTSAISFPGLNGELIRTELKDRGVFVSTASACEPNSNLAVMQSMNIPYEEIMGTIRFSLSRYNNESEVDLAINVLYEIISKMKVWSL